MIIVIHSLTDIYSVGTAADILNARVVECALRSSWCLIMWRCSNVRRSTAPICQLRHSQPPVGALVLLWNWNTIHSFIVFSVSRGLFNEEESFWWLVYIALIETRPESSIVSRFRPCWILQCVEIVRYTVFPKVILLMVARFVRRIIQLLAIRVKCW